MASSAVRQLLRPYCHAQCLAHLNRPSHQPSRHLSMLSARHQQAHPSSCIIPPRELHADLTLLGIESEETTITTRIVNQRFALLAKQVHPDSGHDAACPIAFHSLKLARSRVLDWIATGEADSTSDEETTGPLHPDIRHTAPQHRKYLSDYEVTQHHVNKSLAEAGKGHKDVTLVDQSEMKQGSADPLERIAAAQLKDAIERGEFDNLKGHGKPLPNRVSNPALDIADNQLNQVVKNAGFVPDWIAAQQNIRGSCRRLRAALRESLAAQLQLRRTQPAGEPKIKLKLTERQKDHFVGEIKTINREIDRYNLIVPLITRQMMHIKLERELRWIDEDKAA
eukprot:TRINITY_DN11387_c0_g4_i1.p1 TRINITY_DN11387_c0_g4~~TRINITY_DN11387_c0_g4_i1.p1  ORF type:complete len:338 (+),score=62.75 TRINITY_DN11387_c0_g4_i1:137-1150(+)